MKALQQQETVALYKTFVHIVFEVKNLSCMLDLQHESDLRQQWRVYLQVFLIFIDFVQL